MEPIQFYIKVCRVQTEHDLQKACVAIGALIGEYESPHTVYGFQQEGSDEQWILVLMGTSHPAALLLQRIENVLDAVSAQAITPTPKMKEALLRDYVARQSSTPGSLEISVRNLPDRRRAGGKTPTGRRKKRKKK